MHRYWLVTAESTSMSVVPNTCHLAKHSQVVDTPTDTVGLRGKQQDFAAAASVISCRTEIITFILIPDTCATGYDVVEDPLSEYFGVVLPARQKPHVSRTERWWLSDRVVALDATRKGTTDKTSTMIPEPTHRAARAMAPPCPVAAHI